MLSISAAEPEHSRGEQDQPDEQRQHAPGRATGSSPPAATPAASSVVPVRTGDGRRGADRHGARAAEQDVDDHRHHARVQPDLGGEVGDRGVGHRLGHDDGARRQPADDVRAQPPLVVARQPRPAPGRGRRRSSLVDEDARPVVAHRDDGPRPVAARSSAASAPDWSSNSRSASSWSTSKRSPSRWCDAGEAQHLDVAVGVAAGDQRAPADAAPDAHRLWPARRRRTRASTCTAARRRRRRRRGRSPFDAADHPLRRDAVERCRRTAA